MKVFQRARLTVGLMKYAQGRGPLPSEIADALDDNPALAVLVEQLDPADPADGVKGALPWALILQIIMTIIELLSGGGEA